MKTIFIITIIVLLQIEKISCLSLNDQNCWKYLQKFVEKNYQEPFRFTRIAFAGDVSFVTGTANAKIDIRYSDADFFNDPVYFGLVKEDGKTDEEVCLELKLWKYTSNSYADPVQVTDLTITPSNNFQKQLRYYSFIIPENEFKTRLIETSNSNQFIYTGYYAIAYYAVGTDDLQYAFFFEFSLVIHKETGFAIETAFKQLSEFSTEGCIISSGCNVKPDTQLKWCTDLTCTAFLTPDLHLNDEFVLQQVIIDPRIDRLYLTQTQVWYRGNGLLKRAWPIFINNTIRGQVIIKLKAEIAWSAVTILVTSTLLTLQHGGRMFTQTEFVLASGESDQIDCIKAEGSDTCATCEQEFEANGFAHDGCQRSLVSESLVFKSVAFIFLAVVLIFTIRFLNQSDNKSLIFNYQQLIQS